MFRLRGKLYYGWLVLAAVSGISFANSVTSIGVLTVFIIPITESFHWTRTEVSAATSIGAVLGAASAPFVGRLSDRLGGRLLLATGGVLIVLALLYLSVIQTLLGFYVAFSLARLADQGFVQSISPPAVAKWFVRHRGRALAVLFFATSAGGVVLPPLTQFVIDRWEWRVAWVLLSGVMLVIGLIPVALAVRRQPEDMGLKVDGRAPGQAEPSGRDTKRGRRDLPSEGPEVSWRLSEAFRTPALWLLGASVFMVGVGSTGIALHLVPYFVQRGLTAPVAVGAVSASFLAGAVSNLWWGVLTERVSPRYVLTIVYVIRALSVVLLLVVGSPVEAYLFAVLRGLTDGGMATVGAILLANYFGRRYLGSIYGLNRAIQVGGFALGPLISGLAFDITGTYSSAFVSFLVLTIIGALLVAIARQPMRRALSV